MFFYSIDDSDRSLFLFAISKADLSDIMDIAEILLLFSLVTIDTENTMVDF